MAIYKLGDICSYVEGYVNPPINENIYFSDRSGLPWLKVSELKNGESIYNSNFHLSDAGQKLAKHENQLFKKGSIVWSKSGSVGITSLLETDAMANRGILNIIPNEKYIHKKYLYYFLLKNREYFSSQAVGAVLKHFYGPRLMNEKIELPNLETQKKIIDIIKPIEIEISSFNSLKDRIQNLIISLPITKTKSKKIFKTIKTGKKNADFASLNGKYNFYTAGEKILKCDSYSFDGNYILISGNGNLYSWIYDGKFDAYQRVYVLEPKNDFYTTYFSVQKGLDELRRRSNGAVIKFIKINDLENITKYENNFEDELGILYKTIQKIDTLLYKAKKIQEQLINLLIK